MIDITKDYREILKEELENRSQVNPYYSLRAFARDIKLPAPRLSNILNYKEGLSQRTSFVVAQKLGYNKTEIEIFCNLVESKHARSIAKRKLATIRLKKFALNDKDRFLQEEYFKVISDWYHFAILELTYLKDFQPNPEWIAKTLNVKVELIQSAIHRLKNLKLLKEKNGTLKAIDEFTSTTFDIPSDSIKKFHQQILAKAVQAITMQTVHERDFSSITIGFDQNKLNEAKKILNKFRSEFLNRFSLDDSKNSVYNLSFLFFKLNNELDKKN